MSQSYILYHNHVRTPIPYTVLPQEEQSILRFFHHVIREYLNEEWKSDDKYVIMNDQGDAIIYDKGAVYRISTSD